MMDTRLQIYADRLFNEWMIHGKPIMAVDYDATLSPYHTIENKHDIERAITLLKVAIETGCYITIHTNCGQERYDDIISYVKSLGLKVDSVNETPIDLPFGKKGSKPYANLFIDDRSALPPTLDILEYALYKVRGERAKSLTNGESK